MLYSVYRSQNIVHTRETYNSMNQCYLNLKENMLQESSLKYTDKYILKSSRTAFVSNRFWNSYLSRLRQVPTYRKWGFDVYESQTRKRAITWWNFFDRRMTRFVSMYFAAHRRYLFIYLLLICIYSISLQTCHTDVGKNCLYSPHYISNVWTFVHIYYWGWCLYLPI